jgi:hypothetical protein
MKGEEFMTTDAEFRMKSYGCRVHNNGLRMKGSKFQATDEGFRIRGYG